MLYYRTYGGILSRVDGGDKLAVILTYFNVKPAAYDPPLSLQRAPLGGELFRFQAWQFLCEPQSKCSCCSLGLFKTHCRKSRRISRAGLIISASRFNHRCGFAAAHNMAVDCNRILDRIILEALPSGVFEGLASLQIL